jgi:hypothetical protein
MTKNAQVYRNLGAQQNRVAMLKPWPRLGIRIRGVPPGRCREVWAGASDWAEVALLLLIAYQADYPLILRGPIALHYST